MGALVKGLRLMILTDRGKHTMEYEHTVKSPHHAGPWASTLLILKRCIRNAIIGIVLGALSSAGVWRHRSIAFTHPLIFDGLLVKHVAHDVEKHHHKEVYVDLLASLVETGIESGLHL